MTIFLDRYLSILLFLASLLILTFRKKLLNGESKIITVYLVLITTYFVLRMVGIL